MPGRRQRGRTGCRAVTFCPDCVRQRQTVGASGHGVTVLQFTYMTNDSLEILWRGSDPAKFTALQAALRDEDIQFWHTQVYDPAGGFLSSRPYYLEAVPGFEIRVHASDLRAREWRARLGGKQGKHYERSGEYSRFDHDRARSQALRCPTIGIRTKRRRKSGPAKMSRWRNISPARCAKTAFPAAYRTIPGHRVRLCVRPGDLTRARDIVREITDGKVPE